jgi:signal transduction histidine kinase
MVERAQQLTAAEVGIVQLVTASDELRTVIARGTGADGHEGTPVPVDGTLAGAVLTQGALVETAEAGKDPRVTFRPERWDGIGPVIAVPMSAAEGVRGVLLLGRAVGRPAFGPAEKAPLAGFAGQAALALELADRRRDAEQVSLLADRDRIARDLHDLAIQRLFATGMTLQSAQRFVDHPQAAERLERAVDDLDTTIKIIRSTIFGLREHEAPGTTPGLRMRLVRAVEEAAPGLGFTAALRMEGLLETDVPGIVADDVVAVVVEALSNVARHARATHAEVALAVRKGGLLLAVEDDGIGLRDDTGRRSGLRNLAERATRLNGELTLAVGEGGGTRLEWRVPLAGTERA